MADYIKTGGSDTIYIPRDDKTVLSRSKLEHLSYMAEDDKALESFWNPDSFFSILASGLVFASIGNVFSFFNLPRWGQLLCLAAGLSGFLLWAYCSIRKYVDMRTRNKLRKNLSEMIKEIIEEMNKNIIGDIDKNKN